MYRLVGIARPLPAVPPKVGMLISLLFLLIGLRSVLIGSAAADDIAEVRPDVVDEAVLECFLRGEPAVAVAVLVDLLHRLAGLGGRDLGEAVLHRDDELSLRLDVAGRSAEAAVRLVQQ